MGEKKFEILLLDDEAHVIQSIARILSLKYSVHTAQTPQEAIAILKIHPIHLAILDQNLQQSMTGLDFAKELKQMNQAIKIIMLTGETDSPNLVIEALNSDSIDSFLTKPFDHQELENYIQQNLASGLSRKKNLLEIFEDIRKGRPLDAEDVEQLGDDLTKLESMLFDYYTAPTSHRNDIEIVGAMVFDDKGIHYLNSISPQFQVQDEFLLRGLFLTLDQLSSDLFVRSESNSGQSLDEVRLPNFIAKVHRFEDLRVVLFIDVSEQLPFPVEQEVVSFFNSVGTQIRKTITHEEMSDLLDTELNGLVSRLTSLT